MLTLFYILVVVAAYVVGSVVTYKNYEVFKKWFNKAIDAKDVITKD